MTNVKMEIAQARANYFVNCAIAELYSFYDRLP